MHGGAEPERRGRSIAEGDVFLRGVDVGDEHGDEQEDEANARERAKPSEEKPGGAEEFEHAGDGDEEQGIGEARGNHAGEIVSHLSEVGAGGENEHDGKGVASRDMPGGERGDSESADGAED